MPTPPAHVFRFGVFELDHRSGELRRHGLKVRLPEQSFQILKLLLSRPGDVITRDELRRVLWTAETFVDFEVGLNSAVRKLREALDDSAENPRFVETLPRRGYRFIAPVAAPGVEPALDGAVDQAAVPVPEVAGPRLRSRAAVRRAALLVIVILAAAAGIVYQRGGLTALRAGPSGPILSVVVLPFENLTGDPAQDYFVESVTDALAAHLTQTGLEVISSTTARQYKQTAKRLPEIGRELSVYWVVEGAVARSGTAVHITAKLIRAATDRNVWAQRYEGDVSHMLALQQRIASQISVAAGSTAQRSSGRTPHAIDPRAYDAYPSTSRCRKRMCLDRRSFMRRDSASTA